MLTTPERVETNNRFPTLAISLIRSWGLCMSLWITTWYWKLFRLTAITPHLEWSYPPQATTIASHSYWCLTNSILTTLFCKYSSYYILLIENYLFVIHFLAYPKKKSVVSRSSRQDGRIFGLEFFQLHKHYL